MLLADTAWREKLGTKATPLAGGQFSDPRDSRDSRWNIAGGIVHQALVKTFKGLQEANLCWRDKP